MAKKLDLRPNEQERERRSDNVAGVRNKGRKKNNNESLGTP